MIFEETDTRTTIHHTTMKKSLLALALVAPAFAGEPSAPVYVPPPAPAADCPFSIEAGPVYTVATRHLDAGMGDLDMGGIDITGVYDLNDRWSVTLRAAWTEGDAYAAHWHYTDNQEYYIKDLDATAWSIMPGVRYTAPITDSLSWFAGANIGITNLELEDAWKSDDATGFSYSIEAGVKYSVTEKLYLYGAVQAAGCTADPIDVRDQFGVGIRAGVGFSF